MESANYNKAPLILKTHHPARCLKVLMGATIRRSEHDRKARSWSDAFLTPPPEYQRQLTSSTHSASSEEEKMPGIGQLSAAL